MKSIEYSHIYKDQRIGEQHLASIDRLHELESDGDKRVVMIDDYSPDYGDLDYDEFIEFLSDNDAEPDVVITESSLVPHSLNLIDMLVDKKKKRELQRYINKNGKVPCSLFIATWYMIRLGKLDHDGIIPIKGNIDDVVGDEVLTILPESFVTPESRADSIIRAVGDEAITGMITRDFFNYVEPEYSDFSLFDPEEYASRNYLDNIQPEDLKIVEFVQENLWDSDIDGKSIDMGCGPNIYPALLLSRITTSQSPIIMADVSSRNIDYVSGVLSDGKEWAAWEAITNSDIQSLSKKAIPTVKGFEDLGKEEYDLASQFFVADSITDSLDKFEEYNRMFFDSIKNGGTFIIGNMLGSTQYFAGEREYFPSVCLDETYLKKFYSEFGSIKTLVIPSNAGIRDGYSGMMVTIGRKEADENI